MGTKSNKNIYSTKRPVALATPRFFQCAYAINKLHPVDIYYLSLVDVVNEHLHMKKTNLKLHQKLPNKISMNEYYYKY